MTGAGGRQSTFRQTGGVFCLILLASPFVVYAIGRGLLGFDQVEQSTSRFFNVGSPMASFILYAHMGVGGGITLLAPLQLLSVVRRWVPAMHRVLGYLIATAALGTASAGLFYIAKAGPIGGLWMDAGFALYGILMIVCAVQTIRHARHRLSSHPVWATRLVILVLASWLYRVHYGLWEIATGGIASNDAFTGVFDRVQVFAFYLPYLVLFELWRRRQASTR